MGFESPGRGVEGVIPDCDKKSNEAKYADRQVNIQQRCIKCERDSLYNPERLIQQSPDRSQAYQDQDTEQGERSNSGCLLLLTQDR